MQAYCMKCKAKKEMASPKAVKIKGRSFMKGSCPKCKTTMMRIVASK